MEANITQQVVVGVVGAGLMGAEIALVFALAGHRVLLHDSSGEALSRAMTRLASLLAKGVEAGRCTQEESALLGNITPAGEIAAMEDAAFVTEAVFEDEGVKRAVLIALDQACSGDCIIATNTSTIPISTLAACLPQERRANFIGTHYFSPVTRMKLVEVISGFETASGTADAAMSLLRAIDKTPIAVKDVAGFAVNRMLHSFIIEAVRLVEEGVATPEDIDTACKLGLGHPIGPFALMDAVTSSLCVQAQEIMQEAYGERFRPPPLLKQRVRAGLTGGKGRGGWLR